MDARLAVDGAGLDHHLFGLAAMGATIHAQRAADAAGDAAIEGEPGNASIGRGARHFYVGHGGAGAEARPRLDLDLTEAPAETDHHAGDAAVAHEQVRAEPDDSDRDLARRSPRK